MAYALFAAMLVIAGCEIGFHGRVEDPGIYECTSPNESDPVYRFDTEDPRTTYFLGTSPHIEFVDITTQKQVALYENESNAYKCQRLAGE